MFQFATIYAAERLGSKRQKDVFNVERKAVSRFSIVFTWRSDYKDEGECNGYLRCEVP